MPLQMRRWVYTLVSVPHWPAKFPVQTSALGGPCSHVRARHDLKRVRPPHSLTTNPQGRGSSKANTYVTLTSRKRLAEASFQTFKHLIVISRDYSLAKVYIFSISLMLPPSGIMSHRRPLTAAVFIRRVHVTVVSSQCHILHAWLFVFISLF